MKTLCSVLLGLSAAACTGGYGGGWYDVYGQYCGGGPYPGCDYYENGVKISVFEDPYYGINGPTNFTDQWQSPDGILYIGGQAVNNAGGDESRDIIGEAAAMESGLVEKAGKDFARRYALAEATGIQVARTLNDWAMIGKTRSRTMADVADFSKRLFGVSADEAKVSLDRARAGDSSSLMALNREVAVYWGTTPETSGQILKIWYRDQLAGYGIR